ncbi:O-antigen ligase domain-containing protein [Flavobacteriaceae bacterium AU392]|nr:O-antigen ligase domain-containing protein [Flavobacteriaceae bacterium]RKM82836.1 O-antigen ligase domain-containing protein [Flavobacteriaceae bacterium AU392]
MNIFKSYNYLVLIGIHICIGLGIYLVDSLSKIYFLAILVLGIMNIFNSKPKKKHIYVLMACAYIAGSEVLLRMTGGNFLYEISKYTVILFLIIGVVLGGQVNKKAYPYIIYLLLLVPGVFVALSTLDYGTNVRTAITFNLSGPFCLGISALYCYGKKVTPRDLQKIVQAMLLPIIAMTTYLFLYSPSIKSILSGTGSNFAASGGFGPNQVATVLGLGVFLLAGKFFIQSKTLFYKILNIILVIAMGYRAIVTFSRGGVIVSIVMILALVIMFYINSSKKFKIKTIGYVIFLGGAIILTWFMSSVNTLGLIDKRYNNQDATGRIKEDASTGRAELFTYELNEFFENPILGVGVGKLKELRLQREGIEAATHNEMSRIIGEHGIFGVIAFSILLFTPLIFRFKKKQNIYFYSFYFFWFLTINHSSMRIAAPAFIYGLCLLNIYYEKKSPLHRKQISK